jgi:hypothetical protein
MLKAADRLTRIRRHPHTYTSLAQLHDDIWRLYRRIVDQTHATAKPAKAAPSKR